MEAIILSKDLYTELVKRLDDITTRLNAKNDPKKNTFLDLFGKWGYPTYPQN